ncbi:MAG: serine hydrolase, partial [Bacteroidota bacterium]
LCHRLGFETFQGDFMFFDSDLTTAEVREKMGKLKPLYGFRSKWGYTNSAFMTAGEIIPKVTGKNWAEFVTDSIFKPLGMNNSLALSKDIKTANNKCSAHTVVMNELRKIPYGNIDNLAAAGSISSSVNDMSKWVMAQLSNGKLDGKQIIPAGAIAQTRTPHSIMGNGGHMFNKAHFNLYGLGWFLEEYAGRKIVAHTGGVNGFVTSVCLVPEEKLGIIVLTNTDANSFFEALRNEIEDAYLGLPYRNYSKVFLGYSANQQKETAEWLRKMKDTIATAVDSFPPTAYAGTYRHDVYGLMTIAREENKLVARFEHHKGRYAELELLGPGRFLASFNDPLYGIKEWNFTITKGQIKSVTVRVADFVEFTPYEFIKIK